MRLRHIGLGLALAGVFAIPAAKAASPSVAAAETVINMTAAVMHTQYSEHLNPGDAESGYTPGFGVAASALLPITRNPVGPDLYTSLAYDFSAGDINYNGHYQDGTPTTATDNTVFNRIEARIGVGFPLVGGAEAIPFLAGGYQAWNRNINQKGIIGTDELYSSGLLGGGIKLDIPFGDRLVVSATGEALGLLGGSIEANGQNFGKGFGPTLQERIGLGLDYDVKGRFHVLGAAYWEHFNYSGTQPEYYPGYYIYEPFSVTTQFGANLGIGYSFN